MDRCRLNIDSGGPVTSLVGRLLAILAGITGFAAAAGAYPPVAAPDPSDFVRRATLMRERLESVGCRDMHAPPDSEPTRDLAQWFNFPNWPNWNNWANYWNNWGNFYR